MWIALVACHAGVWCTLCEDIGPSLCTGAVHAVQRGAARCFTVKQKGGGVGGGRARRRRRSGPCEARGHSRLCKPYRSAHYLAARRLSNNIMVQRASAAHKRRSRCTGRCSYARARTHVRARRYLCEFYVHAGSRQEGRREGGKRRGKKGSLRRGG